MIDRGIAQSEKEYREGKTAGPFNTAAGRASFAGAFTFLGVELGAFAMEVSFDRNDAMA